MFWGKDRTPSSSHRLKHNVRRLLLHFLSETRVNSVNTGCYNESLKVKEGKGHPRTEHEGPEREKRYNSALSLTSVLGVSGWSTPSLGLFTTRKETRCPFYRRLVGPQGRSEGCKKSR